MQRESTIARHREAVRAADPVLFQTVLDGKRTLERARRILRDRAAASRRDERAQREAAYTGIPTLEIRKGGRVFDSVVAWRNSYSSEEWSEREKFLDVAQ